MPAEKCERTLLHTGPRPHLLCKKSLWWCKTDSTEKCFHISLLTLVVCHEAKDDFITSNITAIHSRNTGVRAVVEGTCNLSL